MPAHQCSLVPRCPDGSRHLRCRLPSLVAAHAVPAKGDGVREKFRPRFAGAQSPLRVAWLACLALVLATQAAVGEEAGSRAGEARTSLSLAGNSARRTCRDRLGKPHGRRKLRTAADPRRAGLAALSGDVADVTHLHGAAPIEPASRVAAGAEHRVRVQKPDKPPEPARSAGHAVATAPTTLDESIVKEISQRKILFRMCYEPARRRGVTATRADVKWVLAADGSVRDVEVAVAQDALLANCIRAVASRPFPRGVGQDMPVAIPLLFVGTR